MGAIDEIGNRSSLRVKLLHFRPVLEVVHGNLAPRIPQNELALPGSIKSERNGAVCGGCDATRILLFEPYLAGRICETTKIVSVF